MATNPLLGRDIYLALAAVGWADGQLTHEAADAIVRTALEEGLELDAVSEIEEATKTRQEIGLIDRLHMSKSDRLYVYAVASWITWLDGKVTPAEEEALTRLAKALGVPESPRRHADEIMREIATAGDRPDRFDLFALRRRLDEELERARAARAASDG
jgi:tellurite resistance protein